MVARRGSGMFVLINVILTTASVIGDERCRELELVSLWCCPHGREGRHGNEQSWLQLGKLGCQ